MASGLYVSLAFSIALSACASAPSTNFAGAMVDLAQGIQAGADAAARKHGLYLCDATVELKLGATTGESATGGLEGVHLGVTNSSTTGNDLVLHMKSVACGARPSPADVPVMAHAPGY